MMLLLTKSYFSLRYGVLSIDNILEQANMYGIKSILLADINNTTASLEFIKRATDAGIKPIVGVTFFCDYRISFVAVAINLRGFTEINKFYSTYSLQHKNFPGSMPFCEDIFLLYPFERRHDILLTDNSYVMVEPRHLSMLYGERNERINKKMVACFNANFRDAHDFDLHRHLVAIEKNTLLSKVGVIGLATADDLFVNVSNARYIFDGYDRLLKNAEFIVNSCYVAFNFKISKNKKYFTSDYYSDKLLLYNLAYEGAKYRYGKNLSIVVKERLQKELDIIDRLGFAAYFLITWDIVEYSNSKGYYHVGRGSGANSVVAFCLKITDVDPIELDLYFERFLNPKRSSPPDFDIDFSWKNRDDVLRYVFKKHGYDYTALLGTITTFQGRSSIRELSKVYGLPKGDIDELIENRKSSKFGSDPIKRKIEALWPLLHDKPNQRSIHAGGVLISNEPIFTYTGLDLPPKGLPTAQWDMYTAEMLGFEKFDILSQRGIGHIKEAVEIILQNKGVCVDIHQVSKIKNDEQVNAFLRQGNCTGCFYIESPAMRGLLKKLKCDNYLTLVAASSIIRPGVSKSGMMKSYIERYNDKERVLYLHPVMREQLQETYGVMVYQEDVLKVCHHYAGLDLADADVLRRAMSGKYRSKKEFERIVKKFFSNCEALGRESEVTKEVWRQVESFAGYSFSKAHSASFAVESYQSLYLKTYYPHEFMVAVINNFGGFYRTWLYVDYAKKLGCNIHLPCINNSKNYTCIYNNNVYLGFIHIAHLAQKYAIQIERERLLNGPFKDLYDFIARTQITAEQVNNLIRVGAFRFTGKTKQALMWESFAILGNVNRPVLNRLFNSNTVFKLPVFKTSSLRDAFDEIEMLGFPVSLSAFDLLQTAYRGNVAVTDLHNHIGKIVKMVGRFVTYKPIKTVKNDIMAFGTFIDTAGDFFDTVHFAQQLKQYPFTGDGCYLILGKVVTDFDFCSIEVEKMARLPYVKDPRKE